MTLNKGIEHPRVLILTSRFDLSCDLVIHELRRHSADYLRINTEDLPDIEVTLNPQNEILKLHDRRLRKTSIIDNENLTSVFYRRPVYIRQYPTRTTTAESHFSNVHWSVFINNLLLFDKAKWMNNPVETYKAEHKAYQLCVAKRLGFNTPNTAITNYPSREVLDDLGQSIATKGLDTVILRDRDVELFGYTSIRAARDIDANSWMSVPAIIQTALTEKIDVRVTIVEQTLYSVEITRDDKPFQGDWRLHKRTDNVQFKEHELPADVAELCIKYVSHLGLKYGAIDLAFQNNTYYFIEINPTGEWAWLVGKAKLPIQKAIASSLMQIREKS